MRAVDLLIFDLDGTLIDSGRDIASSANAAREAMDLVPLPDRQIMGYIGDGVRKLIERTIEDEDKAQVDRALEIFREHYGEHCLDTTTLYPGIRPVLDHFKSKPMAVISNKPEDFSRKILTELGVLSHFKLILGGDSGLPLKPAPEALVGVMDNCGASPERACMIGDGCNDIEAGRNAGCITCAVTFGLVDKNKLKALEPDYVVDHALDLIRLFV